ncbi:jg7042 [Pararge aegeria aegeria]|uniref:Jg7042 protein n=1 Tax=Pararge aegeria aegeria TaxID=348720 RepID=A0A8S4RHM2_9NEOP|nr:jg7042 [Pararge aegeria aegeria]
MFTFVMLRVYKIKKKYAPLGESVVVVKLERSPKAGLGLSLAGHRDRSRMAVFVCGMNPAGSAAKSSPPIKVGDEILEVNGLVLHGRCHLNASVIIKGLVGPVFKIILLRRKAALEDVAVKPITQFPVALEENSSYCSISTPSKSVRVSRDPYWDRERNIRGADPLSHIGTLRAIRYYIQHIDPLPTHYRVPGVFPQ